MSKSPIGDAPLIARSSEVSSRASAGDAIDPLNLPAILVLHRGRVVDSNRPSPRIFGAPRDQIVAELENILRDSGEQSCLRWPSRRLDGSRFTVEASLSPIEIGGHATLLAVLVDLTPDLAGRLLQRQDEERRRVARQLHNQAGQNLSALNIHLSILQQSLQSSPGLAPRSREALQEAIDLADASIREIRKLSYELHPPLLDELGLVSALRAYVEAYSTSTGIQVNLNLPAAELRLPPAAEIGLFRILEEGLSTATKSATITFKLESDRAELELVAPGRRAESPAIMQERARQLGGSLTIASGPHGTALHVVIPAFL